MKTMPTENRDLNEADEITKVILLSGFLGSGKTTLIQNLISLKEDMSDTVIILNEFGKAGIDGLLLDDTAYKVVMLSSGCICCSLVKDLKNQLISIKNRINPRYIIIEASGVADPVSVVAAFHEPDIKKNMELLKIITVIDADCWKIREMFGELFYNQLKIADMILLNKIDLHNKDKVSSFLNQMHDFLPDKQIVPTLYCKVDYEMLLLEPVNEKTKINRMQKTCKSNFFSAIQEYGAIDKKTSHKNLKTAKDSYVTFSFKEKAPLNETRFKKFIEKLPFELFRIKGIVNFQDRTVFFNFAGGKGEWSKWDGTPETYLEFIGWDIVSDEILKELDKCILKEC